MANPFVFTISTHDCKEILDDYKIADGKCLDIGNDI